MRALNIGSDSPSKVAALVSWRSEELSGSKLRVGKLLGASETRGICEEELEKGLSTLRWADLHRLFAAEPVLPYIASTELGGEPDSRVKACGSTSGTFNAHTLAIAEDGEELYASTSQASEFATGRSVVTCMPAVCGGNGLSFCRAFDDTNLALVVRFLNRVMDIFSFSYRAKRNHLSNIDVTIVACVRNAMEYSTRQTL